MPTVGSRADGPRHSLRGLVAVAALLGLGSAAASWALGDLFRCGVSLVLVAASVARLGSPPLPSTSFKPLATMSRALARIVLLLVTCGGSIAFAELATRWIYRDVTTTANFRGYFTNNWLRSAVRTNHYGYRAAEFEEVKAPGVYRVAVLGDSFTFGNGVGEAARFSNLVGEAVKGRGIEVLNFGVPGNNWPEHVATLERRVLRLRPDFVLLQWGTNDVELDADIRNRPPAAHPIANRDWHEWLFARSAFYILLDAKWAALMPWRPRPEPYDAYVTRLYGDPASEGARHAEALMRRFIALCRERGVEVGLVLVPDTGVRLDRDYPYRFLHERVLALCGELGVTCRDLRDAFAAVPDRLTLWVSPFDSHPSVLANRLIADEVLASFAPGWNASATGGLAATGPNPH